MREPERRYTAAAFGCLFENDGHDALLEARRRMMRDAVSHQGRPPSAGEAPAADLEHIEAEAAEPTESKTAEPTGAEAAEPTGAEAAEHIGAEAAEPAEAEAAEPIEAEAAESIEAEAAEPIEAKAAEDIEAKAAEPRKPPVALAGDAPEVEEQEPPLDATDSDDVDADADGLDGADTFSAESVTVRSSILDHEYECGRRYHHFRRGRYPLPNDDIEQEREYMKHVIHMEHTGGKLFNAPIAPNPQRILDLCTGTGLWPMAVARMFPSAEIVGLDLSPIQPSMVPPNVRFLIDDVEDEWMDRGGYDLIHLRHSCIYLRDVDKLIHNCYAHLKEGGWLEITDYCSFVRCDDGTMPDDHPPRRVAMMMHQAFLQYGMNTYIVNELEDKFSNAGFKNIQCRVVKTPIGAWPKDPAQRQIGILFRDCIHELVAALAAKPLRNLGWDEAALEVYLMGARAALRDKKVHCYADFVSWWAQK